MQTENQVNSTITLSHHNCDTLICHTCLFFKNKDTSFASIDAVAKNLALQVDAGFRNVRLSLNNEINQTKQLITETHRIHEKNQNKIHEAFASLHQLINKHEAILKENIATIEKDNTKQLNDYEIHLLKIENSLDFQQAQFCEIVSKGQHVQLLQREYGSVDYLNKIHKELGRLKAPRRTQYDLQGLENLSKIKDEILQCGTVDPKVDNSLAYENSRLEKIMVQQTNPKMIDLSDQQLNDQDVKLLVEKYHEITALSEFNISKNQISSKGIKYLASMLQQNKELSVLILGDNQIGHRGTQYLCHALEKNMTLTTLDLESNQISDDGVKHIATMMNNITSLEILNLQRNFVGTNGLKDLAQALKRNTVLTTLNLSWNRIGDKGAEHIADALRENKTLTTLDLQQNCIGCLGASHIANALRINTTLVNLSLQQNHIGPKGVKYFADALHDNESLTSLSLSGNRFGQNGVRDLINALDRNRSLTCVLVNGVNLCRKRRTLNETLTESK
ncbi:unnamed protein product [Rotaria socialis]|uniref:Uncharacterized protein n=1 Tax=Rotaria socialis TaxID=392032 RepID=A0A818E436_9BILA|nr:unnamed protein product [Rotaria socialis]CAF4609147.1 unnamed protein product [Rotaria socialis]